MAVWRLQTNSGTGKITNYCFENKIAALGWSFREKEEVTDEIRNNIKSFEDYSKIAKKIYKAFGSAKRLAYDVKEGDLIWMRDEHGIYYLGRVGNNPKWSFNNDAFEIDACNQLSNVDWHKLNDEGDESCVPGSVATAFIKGSTLQRINKDGVQEYTALLYDELAGTDYYSDISLDFNEKSFYSLLSPSDCEDLLYAWLYKEYGYICVPSSNKISTPNYECVLLDPKTGEHIYIQVKKGDDSDTNKIDAENYKNLKGKVWFLKTEGRVINIENYKDSMEEADSTTLFEFACAEESNNIISPNIKKWVDFLRNQSNKKSENKGVIFDTNKSFNPDGEKEMFENNQIIAWGDASRYIDAFNVNDYVLYYSKGKGIIAIGKIVSVPEEDENKKFCKVEPIVFPDFSYSAETDRFIGPKELKNVLNRNFYFASTRKVPFISEEDVHILIDLLKKKLT